MSVKADVIQQALCRYMPRPIAHLILSFGETRAEEAETLYIAFMDLMRVRIRQHPLLRTHRQVAALHDFWKLDTTVSLNVEYFPVGHITGDVDPDEFPSTLHMPYETVVFHRCESQVEFHLRHVNPPAGCDCLVCQYHNTGNTRARETWCEAWAERATRRIGWRYVHEWHDCECRDCRD
jgi:hypothetical protein